MNIEKLKEVLQDQPKFRFRQCYQAVFFDFIKNWDEATNLPLSLRVELNKNCPLDINSEISESKNKKTFKALITLSDKEKIETVLMRHGNRNTVCVSAQIGCPLKCKFCATGQMGFIRDLESMEIIEQVLLWSRYLKKYDERVTNIVFMGMGEPFLNYENVMQSIKLLNDHQAFNIGARHISISTVGLVDGIKKLAKEDLQINLAISLHATNDKLRSELMPINKEFHLTELFRAIDDYIEKTNRRVMFEYLLIKGINDSERDARSLAKIMGNNKLYLVNLIPYNPIESGLGNKFKSSDNRTIEKFMEILTQEKVNFTQRYKFGKDIKGACGQLAGKE
ncbi:23S rRNA (adenine(2503)-C(2))-methyltransferase RlmN [bacterium]|nr:23S rRNA (adenine(2503)-C(2))-methyltransferase RlmN [bacterium]